MQQDQDDDESSTFYDIPSLKEAVKERKEHIAWLREGGGDSERAALLAKCRKGNRCYLDDCAVCRRRHQIKLSKVPESVIDSITSTRSNLRFVVYDISVSAIKIKGPRRPLDEKKLRALKASITLIGPQTPITVRIKKGKFELVTGFYRLVAMKELGAKYIPCYEHYCEESESYQWQRSENVYRAEPRVLDRAEYIDESRQAVLQNGGQVAPPGGCQPKDAGIKKAAKALGFTREEVRRSKAIAGISPEAKAEARSLGLDDNQHALLEIAKLPANAQRAAVKAIVERQRAAHARLASRAAVVGNTKAVAKMQAIEAKITKKEDTLKSLKEELVHEHDRLHKVQDEVVAACVNNALITDPSAQPADEEGIEAVPDESLSPEDEASLERLNAAWDNASPVARERFMAIRRSCDAQESKKAKEAEESDWR